MAVNIYYNIKSRNTFYSVVFWNFVRLFLQNFNNLHILWGKNPFLMPWYPNNMHNVKLITHPLAPTFSTFNDNALPTSSIWLHLHHVLHRLYACDLCAQSNVKGHPPTRDVSVGISTFIWTFSILLITQTQNGQQMRSKVNLSSTYGVDDLILSLLWHAKISSGFESSWDLCSLRTHAAS